MSGNFPAVGSPAWVAMVSGVYSRTLGRAIEDDPTYTRRRARRELLELAKPYVRAGGRGDPHREETLWELTVKIVDRVVTDAFGERGKP